MVAKLKLKDPLKHVAQIKKKRSLNEAADEGVDTDTGEFQDKWEVRALLNIPASLTKCSQDCRILSNIKVRHKIKFTISLLNPDGHISELRAALPVQLFISPFVPVNVKTSDVIERTLKTFGPSYQVTSQHDNSFSSKNFVDDSEEDVIFQRSASALQLSSMPTIVSGSTLNINSTDAEATAAADTTMVTSLMVPPNYGNHVYDRVYGEVTNEDETSASASSSAIESQAIHNIQNLYISDSNNSNNPILAPNPQIKIEDDSLNNCDSRGDSVNNSNLNLVNSNLTISENWNNNSPSANRYNNIINAGLNSPSLTPSFAHLSRRNSYSRQTSSTSLKNDLELTDLSRVPSYDKAMKSDMIGEDLPPAYPEEELGVQENKKIELERPQILHHKSTSSLLPLPGSSKSSNNLKRSSSRTHLSHSPLPRNNSGSSVSLQQLARNNTDSSFNLNLSFTSAKSSTGSRHFPFNMTTSFTSNSSSKNNSHFDKTDSTSDANKPREEENYTSATHNRRSRSSSVRSNNSNSPLRQGTGSFANLMEMFTKRDRS